MGENTEITKKAKRRRSPRHPYYSLEDCMGLADKLIAKYGLKQVHTGVLLEHLGFSPNSGVAMRLIASLRGFGLIDQEGTGGNRFVWLSDLGKQIVLDKRASSPEWRQAVRTAALTYGIISDLSEIWPSLPSDEKIKKTLLIEKGFSIRAAKRFVPIFRETYEFAQLGEPAVLPNDEESIPGEMSIGGYKGYRVKTETKSGGIVITEQSHTIPLIGGEVAIFSAPRPLSKENFEHIKKWFDLMEPAFVVEEKREQVEDDEQGTGEQEQDF